MKVLDALKIVWRSILTVNEEKLTFYRRNRQLVENKKWDYLFRVSRNKGVNLLFFDSEKELLWLEKDGVQIVTNDDYGIFIEIMIDKAYMLPPQLTGDFCVFDVGMNRGFASLFFANYSNCMKVIGFELDDTIYEKALQNFALNKLLSKKIVPYNFGLWSEDGQVDICQCKADGNTGIESCIENQPHLTNKMQDKKLKAITKAPVKNSSEVLAPMLSEMEPAVKKVLKIDIEGAEYAVFENLHKNGLLKQFDVIIGEAHNGTEGLEKYLSDFVCVNKNKLSNLLITFCYVNKRIV